MDWKLLGVLVGTPFGIVVGGYLAVRAVRWARKNRADAAAGLVGLYGGGIEDRTGGAPVGDEANDGWWNAFRSWLGDKVDAMVDSAHHSGHGDDAFDADTPIVPDGDLEP